MRKKYIKTVRHKNKIQNKRNFEEKNKKITFCAIAPQRIISCLPDHELNFFNVFNIANDERGQNLNTSLQKSVQISAWLNNCAQRHLFTNVTRKISFTYLKLRSLHMEVQKIFYIEKKQEEKRLRENFAKKQNFKQKWVLFE